MVITTKNLWLHFGDIFRFRFRSLMFWENDFENESGSCLCFGERQFLP